MVSQKRASRAVGPACAKVLGLDSSCGYLRYRMIPECMKHVWRVSAPSVAAGGSRLMSNEFQLCWMKRVCMLEIRILSSTPALSQTLQGTLMQAEV